MKRLPGRPRKDGLPPIQHKTIAAIEGEEALRATQRDAKVVARVRYLGGLGLPLEDIAVDTGLTIEDLKQGGRYYYDIRVGIKDANLEIAKVMFEKAKTGKYVETMFYAKARMGWSETPQGRAKVAAEKGEGELTGIDVEFDDFEHEMEQETPEPAPAAKKPRLKRVA